MRIDAEELKEIAKYRAGGACKELKRKYHDWKTRRMFEDYILKRAKSAALDGNGYARMVMTDNMQYKIEILTEALRSLAAKRGLKSYYESEHLYTDASTVDCKYRKVCDVESERLDEFLEKYDTPEYVIVVWNTEDKDAFYSSTEFFDSTES